MKTAMILLLAVCGALCDASGGETNVVFARTLGDDRKVEIRESVVFDKVDTNSNNAAILASGGAFQAMHTSGGCVRYEMVIRNGESKSVKIWGVECRFLMAGTEDNSRCRFLDIVAKGGKLALLYSKHVAVCVDVVDTDNGAVKNSHFLCTTMSPRAVSVGRLAWLDDDIYVLFKTGNTKCVVFLLEADGKCTRMDVRPDTLNNHATIDGELQAPMPASCGTIIRVNADEGGSKEPVAQPFMWDSNKVAHAKVIFAFEEFEKNAPRYKVAITCLNFRRRQSQRRRALNSPCRTLGAFGHAV